MPMSEAPGQPASTMAAAVLAETEHALTAGHDPRQVKAAVRPAAR